jgi:hypothetical protein
MDHRTFDRLARIVGSGQSRRNVLKTLTAGALGAVAAPVRLDRVGAAARCRAQGVVCSKNADCCTSACLPRDRTGRRVCGGGDFCTTPLADVAAISCGPGACYSFVDADGSTICIDTNGPASCDLACSSDADCDPTMRCIRDTGDDCSCENGAGFCGTACGAVGPSGLQATVASTGTFPSHP